MSEMLWGSTTDKPRTFHRIRAEVLEHGVRLELLVGGALAAGYGQTSSLAQELQHELFHRISIEQRIAMLKRVLDRMSLIDTYPFVIPILTRLFELRNDFAHSLSDGYDPESRSIQLISVRKGKESKKSYGALYLHWLVKEQCPVVERELAELYFSIAPGDAEWHKN